MFKKSYRYKARRGIKRTGAFRRAGPRSRTASGGGFRGRRTYGGRKGGYKRASSSFKRTAPYKRSRFVPLRSQFRRSRPTFKLPSPRQLSIAALKTGNTIQVGDTFRAAFKGPYGKKFILMDSLASPVTGLRLLGLQPTLQPNGNLFCAAFNWQLRHVLKNWSSYPVNLQVKWWTCRQKVVVEPSSPYANSIGSWYVGITAQAAPTGGQALQVTDPQSSFFMNPIWCSHWKCTKRISTRIEPYRQKAFKLFADPVVTIHKEFNSGLGAGDLGNIPHAVCSQYGMTTKLITFELLGDLSPDGGAFPASMNIVHSPLLLSVETQERVLVAQPQYVTEWIANGDADEPTVTSLQSLNPFTWNGATLAGTTGSTPFSGGLTSGI